MNLKGRITVLTVCPVVRVYEGERPVGHRMTAAEWLRSILAQGMVYTRLFDEKLGVSQTAKALAEKVSHNTDPSCVSIDAPLEGLQST